MTEFIGPTSTVSSPLTDRELCLPSNWHPLFKNCTEGRVMKTEFIHLDNDFLRYLLADGLTLPEGTSIHGVGGDQLSDDEGTTELRSNNSQDCSPPSFPSLTASISSSIRRLKGRVFAKVNGVSCLDAAWVSGGSAMCHSPGDVFLMLKASDKISAVAHAVHSDSSVNSSATLSLVKWANFFPSMEFRCFVKSKRLVGLCQRNCSTHFEHLADESVLAEVESVVSDAFYKSICGIFPLSSYVMDVYLDKQRRVWLLDFSPLNPSTNTLLFDWSAFSDDCNDPNDEVDGIDVMVRVVRNSSDLLPHLAGQSRGPTDAIDHQAEVSSCLKMSLSELRRLQAQESSCSDGDEYVNDR